jgi:hypothetical protein
MSSMDAEVLIAIPVKSSLDIPRPIYEYCASRGLRPEGEAIRVGDWPVQFIPAFSPLTEEALHEAEIAEVEGVPLRVVRASHLGVIALSAGRPKDYARILSLLESGSVSRDDLRQLADRHGLSAAWQRGRASLSWEEKIRQALIMREVQRSLRGNASDPSPVQGRGHPPEKKPPR